MGLLTKIEELIATPFEKFHTGKGFEPVDLTRMAVRSLEQGCRKGLRCTYAPNAFRIQLHPDDYQELAPFVDTIVAEVTEELERLVAERGYRLAGRLVVTMVKESAVATGEPRVEGMMQGSDEPASVVAFTPMPPGDTDDDDDEARDQETVLVLGVDESTTAESRVVPADDLPTVLAEEETELLVDEDRPASQDRSPLPADRAVVARPGAATAPAGPGRAGEQTASQALLEIPGSGVAVQITPAGVFLLNPDLDPAYTVDGRIGVRLAVNHGATLTLGGAVLRFQYRP